MASHRPAPARPTSAAPAPARPPVAGVPVSGPRRAGARIQSVAEGSPLALVVFGVFLYATGPVMVAASSVSGPVFALWRLWFGVGVFALLTFVHRLLTGRRTARGAWKWSLAAGTAFAVHQLVFVTAIKVTSVVDVLLVSALSPIVTGAAAIPMFGERPGTAFRLWSVVAIAGSAVVIVAGSAGPDGDPLGMTLALFNVFAFAAFFLLSKRGRDHIDVVPFLFGVVVVAAVAASGYVALTGGDAGAMQGGDWILALATAVVPGTLGHFVMTWPLRWVPANVPPLIRLGIPVISGFLAWVFLDQAIGVGHVGGGLLVFAGVAGALLSPSGRRLVAREATGDLPDRPEEDDATGTPPTIPVHTEREGR